MPAWHQSLQTPAYCSVAMLIVKALHRCARRKFLKLPVCTIFLVR